MNRFRVTVETVRRRLAWTLLITLASVCVAPVAMAVPPAKVALQGGDIIPIVGDEIKGGTILFEHGKITAIGKTVDIPYDAMVVDVSGKVLMPGMIDAHSARGLDRSNESLPVTPYLDVYDAIDPSRLYFEDALRDGITSIHVIVANNCVIGGLGRVVHPIGLTPDEMTQLAPTGLKISIAPKRGYDRMAQMAKLRETFLELPEYLERLAETKYEESLEEKDKKIDVSPEEARKLGKELIQEEDYDDHHDNLVKLTGGKLATYIYCQKAADVARAESIAKENGFFEKSVWLLGSECFKAVAAIKSAGRPIILDSELIHRERDSMTGKLTETFVPKVYADAGVAFSLLPNRSGSMGERYVNYQAARCMRHGISRRTSLEAITINPAKALGISDRVGSLEVGKVANIVAFSGDPLDFNSWVDLVYINGIRAYNREDDVRLKRLFGQEKDEVAHHESPKKQGEAPAEPDGSPDSDSVGDGGEPADKKG